MCSKMGQLRQKGIALLFYYYNIAHLFDAGWSSLVARRAHNPKVVGSNPAPATNSSIFQLFLLVTHYADLGTASNVDTASLILLAI